MNKLLPILALLFFGCDVEDILDNTIHTGCSDENACNYSSQVTADDGSCEYPPIDILGCDCDNYEIIGECSNSGQLYCQESACYD
tara:strand:+ start:213 stop:467 length:255 start_codon:yes stop_codon:yes gene_type:complete